MLGLILGLSLCLAGLLAAIPDDTARLAAHLAKFRKYQVYELDGGEYRAIQTELFAWIDSRLKTGKSVAALNAELKVAKLLSKGPETVDDEFDRTCSGSNVVEIAEPDPPPVK